MMLLLAKSYIRLCLAFANFFASRELVEGSIAVCAATSANES